MPFLSYLPHGPPVRLSPVLMLTGSSAYPEYAASVLASNDFFRSMLGMMIRPPEHQKKVDGHCSRCWDASCRSWVVCQSRYRLGKYASGMFDRAVRPHTVSLVYRTSKGTLTYHPVLRFLLFKFGPWLRSKSPRALHDDELKKRKKDMESGSG